MKIIIFLCVFFSCHIWANGYQRAGWEIVADEVQEEFTAQENRYQNYYENLLDKQRKNELSDFEKADLKKLKEFYKKNPQLLKKK